MGISFPQAHRTGRIVEYEGSEPASVSVAGYRYLPELRLSLRASLRTPFARHNARMSQKVLLHGLEPPRATRPLPTLALNVLFAASEA